MKYLFIGGPADGQWIDVPRKYDSHVITKILDPNEKVMPDLEFDKMKTTVNLKNFIYRKECLRDGIDSQLFHVFRYEHLKNIMRSLIEGYHGLQES